MVPFTRSQSQIPSLEALSTTCSRFSFQLAIFREREHHLSSSLNAKDHKLEFNREICRGLESRLDQEHS